MYFFIHNIIPFFYLVLVAFLLQRDKNLRNGGLVPGTIIFFFLLKSLAGVLYSYMALRYIPNRGDIWGYFDVGYELFQTLIHQPSQLGGRLREMFSQTGGATLDSQSGTAKSAFEGIKLLQFIFNLFSWGNLYTNTILFNGLASWAFLRCWVFLKKEWHSWVSGAWLFLFPSAFFYTSGIHKEGIIFILLACLLPICYRFRKGLTLKKLLSGLLLMALFLFFKLFVALLFAGSMLLYFLLTTFPKRRLLVLLLSITAAILVFFSTGLIWPAHSLPAYIVQRQQEFLAMDASSSFTTVLLEPNATSFISAFPRALYNVFLRPLPGQGGKTLYYAYTFEIFTFWAIIVFMAIKNRFRTTNTLPSMLVALAVFAFFNLLIIGYTIPNIGATMRYRSIFLPFIGLFAWSLLRRPMFSATGYGKARNLR